MQWLNTELVNEPHPCDRPRFIRLTPRILIAPSFLPSLMTSLQQAAYYLAVGGQFRTNLCCGRSLMCQTCKANDRQMLEGSTQMIIEFSLCQFMFHAACMQGYK